MKRENVSRETLKEQAIYVKLKLEKVNRKVIANEDATKSGSFCPQIFSSKVEVAKKLSNTANTTCGGVENNSSCIFFAYPLFFI